MQVLAEADAYRTHHLWFLFPQCYHSRSGLAFRMVLSVTFAFFLSNTFSPLPGPSPTMGCLCAHLAHETVSC